MTAEIPAGWYPNPWNDAEELYWSGVEWTGISRAVHRAAPVGETPGGMPVQASAIEDSTVMRPVGASASSFAPQGAPAPSFAQASAPLAQPVAAPQYETPQYETPQYETPQYETPQYETPQYPTAHYAHPHYAHPQYEAPQLARPQDAAPQYGTPQYGTPQHPAPDYEQQSYPAQQHYPAQPTADQPYSTATYPSPDQPYSTATYPTEPFSPTPYLAQPNPAYGTDPAAAHDPTDAASIRWALGDSAPAGPTVNPRAKFGLVAMILGIVAAVFAIIPGLSFAAWIPAFVAITLGILAYVAGRPRTFALVGIITGGAALAVGTGVSLWFVAQLGVLAH